MTHTVIPDQELLALIEKKVNPNGQIYIGREYRGLVVRAYIVKSEAEESENEYEGKTIAARTRPNASGVGSVVEYYIRNPDGTVYQESDR